MDRIYTVILDFLNSLLPSGQLSSFGNINEILAYIITLNVIYFVIFKPLFKVLGIFSNSKRG